VNAAAPPPLEVEGLRVEMRSEAATKLVVNKVDFTLHQGQVLGIVGGSGSGKTTTLRAVLRRLPPAGRVVAGSIRFHGEDVLTFEESRLREIRGGRIAIIVQNPIAALSPIRHVGDQMRALAVQHGVAASEDSMQQSLADAGIANPTRVLRSYPHELSGGMAQRVLIAIALSLEPEILLADEPTSALDVTIQAQIMELIRSIVGERGLSVLLVTHDIALVSDYCDDVLVLSHGEVVERGPVEQVIHRPARDYTRELVESAHLAVGRRP
jgi:ABC-type dipeptide/oligopeptide/nickel transport system ATPase component